MIQYTQTEIYPYNQLWYSISQAAKYLKVSTKTLRRWDKAGILKPTRNPNNHRLYSSTHLNQLKSTPKLHLLHHSKNDRFLTISQAADKLQVSTKTLRRWDKAKKIKSVRNSRGQRLFLASQIDILRRQQSPISKRPAFLRLSSPQSWQTMALPLIILLPTIMFWSLFKALPPTTPTLSPLSIDHQSLPNHLPPTTIDQISKLKLNIDNSTSLPQPTPSPHNLTTTIAFNPAVYSMAPQRLLVNQPSSLPDSLPLTTTANSPNLHRPSNLNLQLYNVGQ